MNELIVFFVVYGILGWTLDTGYRSLIAKKFSQGSFLNLPFCTSYGLTGLILIKAGDLILSLNIIEQFFILAAGLAAIEFILGSISHRIWKKRFWDYRKAKFNLLGHTDLQHAIYWGFLGLLFLHILHPFIESVL